MGITERTGEKPTLKTVEPGSFVGVHRARRSSAFRQSCRALLRVRKPGGNKATGGAGVRGRAGRIVPPVRNFTPLHPSVADSPDPTEVGPSASMHPQAVDPELLAPF